MSYSCGFDIYSKLNAEEHRDIYDQFTSDILEKYGNVVDHDSHREDREVLEFPGEALDDNHDMHNITFKIGGCPKLSWDDKHCEYFLRFTSNVSDANASAKSYIKEVTRIAKENFGDRVRFWH